MAGIHGTMLNFPDQLVMLAEGLKILPLLGFNNFLGWFIQVPRRGVSFRTLCFICQRE